MDKNETKNILHNPEGGDIMKAEASLYITE